MEYKYKDLTQHGYTKVSIPRSLHNKVFPRRKIKWCYKYEYYVNDGQIIIQRFTNIWVKLLLIPMFPVYVVMIGFPETLRETKQIFQQKKYGSFSQDLVNLNSVPELDAYLKKWGYV